jgi:uncharacterized membrane protein YjgN (DUF898 family)
MRSIPTTLATHLAASTPPPESRFEQRSVAGEVMLLHFKNIALTILTLGLYRFWARTAMRRYLWSTTEIFGEPLEYTGTGGELFKSFLRAMLLVMLVYGLVFLQFVVLKPSLPGTVGLVVVDYVGFFCLGLYASYSARRYRVSRTLWRGLRCDQAGSPLDYVKLTITPLVGSFLTLGLASPYFAVTAYAYAFENTYVGSQAFSFDGRARDLMRWRLVAWLLTLPTLGLAHIWYLVKLETYLIEHTRFGAVRFRPELDPAEVGFMLLGNLALLVVTAGLAMPWVMTRILRFYFERVAVLGKPDFAALTQSTAPVRAGGDGLLDLLDGDIA